MTRTHPFSELRDEALQDPVRRERIKEYRRATDIAVALGKLRSDKGVTQKQLAESLHVSQANVSRIEHAEDLFLSTLRGYVEALGGELRLTAVFPDEEIIIEPAAGTDMEAETAEKVSAE